MAIKMKPVAMIRDYWPRFWKQGVVIAVLVQLAATLAIGCILLFTNLINDMTAYYLVLVAIFAILSLSNGVVFILTTSPLRDITSAITHISGEPTTLTPPNPNAKRFEKIGLKPILQFLYELAAKPKKNTPDMSIEAANELTEAFDHASAGFIVMTAKKQVIFANKKAPIHADHDGAQVLDLVFEDDDTLDTWLASCEESAVHAEHTWQRVANKIVGEEDRKIYDIAASYQKGSRAEVVLTLFDKTGTYLPEDEDLDFVAFAAHELRGPITVIRGYLDVLSDELEDTLSGDQVELMKRLVVSANRLSSYVNNILNASRYDRRHLKMHLKEDSIRTIYDTIADDMQLRASSQNRMLSVHFPEDLPTIAADRASISEVLSNLIDNAIKYSNEGGIVNVTARVDEDYVKVSVEDHGVGMPGNVVSNLFHKFYRSHRSRETVAGTGIGLYICKAIIESHGGKISVRSVEREGSTFEFSLPIYSTVADKLQANNNSNEGLIEHDETGWIKNHAMYRG